MLLIDTLNTPKEDQSFARRQVADCLNIMPAGTSLAIFSVGQTLRMVRGFTNDRANQNGGHLAMPVSAIFLTDTGVTANRATRAGNALAADLEKLPAPVHVIDSAQGLDGLMLRFGRSR